MRSAARWGALLPVAAIAVWVAVRLWAVCRAQAGLPMWDEAAHGLAGIEVAEAIRRLDPLALLLSIQRQALWPFAHSLMLAPAFLIGGIGLAPAEAVSVILYAGTTLLLFVAGTQLDRARGPWIGAIAASLALLAPSYRVYGTLAFLEMPGAFLLLLAFTLHASAGQGPWRLRRLAAAGWASTALVLCKYNYGLLWLAALLFWEWEALAPEARRRALAGMGAALGSARAWRRPVPLIFAAGAVATLAIVLTGGGAFTLFGQRISARSPGNLLYALWLLGLAWLLIPRRSRSPRAIEAWRRLPPRARTLAVTIIAPLAIWFALPGHLRELVNFAGNRDSGIPLWKPEAWAFYPRSLALDYAPIPLVGWAALALALWPPDQERRAARLAWLAFAVALLLTVLHRYRDSRFLFTVCPMLWLCAADRAASILGAAFAPLRWKPARVFLWSALAVGALACAGWQAAHDTSWPARRAALRVPVDVAPALDAVLEQIDPASVDAVLAERVPLPGGRIAFRDAPPRLALLGYANTLSPGLLAWHARLTRPDLAPSRLPRRVPSAGDRIAWLDTHADVVLTALADSGGVEYEREVADDRALAARLEAESDGWRERSNARVGRFHIARFARQR